jgi:cytochrome P450
MATNQHGQGGTPPPFDINELNVKSSSKLVERILQNPFWIFAILRFVAPVFRIPIINWTVVTRFDHAKEVLAKDQVFGVPWLGYMEAINAIAILGIDNHEDHAKAQKQLMWAFKLEDLPRLRTMTEDLASELIEQHRGRQLDAVQDLLTLVATRICRNYYGLPISPAEEKEFGQWSIAISMFLFGNPADNPTYRRLAIAGIARMRVIVDAAIANGKAGNANPDTIVARLVRMQVADPLALPDHLIQTHLIGMVSGFVPTDTMAAGHILDALVGTGVFSAWTRRKFQRPTRRAIHLSDDDLLTRCLLETSRFWPINFGPFRTTSEDYTIAGAGWFGLGSKTIPSGAKLLVSTEAAMFDGRSVRRPYHFDPDRPSSQYMLFGSGMHVCVGLLIAKIHITHTFKILLRQKNLRRAKGKAGKLTTFGPFPAGLSVEYDS